MEQNKRKNEKFLGETRNVTVILASCITMLVIITILTVSLILDNNSRKGINIISPELASKNVLSAQVTDVYSESMTEQTMLMTTERNKNYVLAGERIDYKITVANEEQIEKDVLLTDRIPEGTTLVAGSIQVNGDSLYNEIDYSNKTAEDLATGIEINIPEQEEVIVTFSVEVKEGATGDIVNTAAVDENTTNEVRIPILKYEKVSKEKHYDLMEDIDYTETLDNITNPERGFYSTQGLRMKLTDNKASAIYSKLTHLRVSIGDYSAAYGGQDVEFTEDALNALNGTLENARKAGASIIIRFAYDNYNGKGNVEPPLDLILKHISQLKPVFYANEDVIAYIELGFFGPWGEMHTSSICTTENVSKAIDAMLDAAPKSIKIGVRTPNYFAKWAGVDRAKLSEFIAEKGTDAYRVGLFNDGYLGSESDLGTFANREIEVSWLEKQAMHTLYGGEVVANYASGTPLNTAAYMSKEAFRTHTTYLNSEWNGNVINAWKSEIYNGDDELYNGQTGYLYIANHLGYRLVLRKSEVTTEIKENDKLGIKLQIENVGFANIINDKKVTLVLEKDGKTYEIPTNIDPTTWNSTEISNVNLVVDIPEDIQLGEWNIYLRISQHGDMDTDNNYKCIQFANSDIWNQSFGANYIGKVEISEKVEDINVVTVGDTIYYGILLHNTGSIEIEDIEVIDTIPEGTKINGQMNNTNELSWTIDKIGEGETEEVGFTVEVKQLEGIETITNVATVEGQDTNEITHIYVTPDILLQSTLNATGPEEITTKEEKIEYKVEFNANVNYFKGKAIITIVDKLQYPIDIDESEIDEEGYYDSDNQTITWTKKLDINTIETQMQEDISITKTLKLKYIYGDINETTGNIINSVESVIELQQPKEDAPEEYKTVKDDRKAEEVETLVKIPTEVIVYHYIYDAENQENTEISLVKEKHIDGIIGEEYTTTASSEIPKNYECINATPKDYKGKMKEKTIEVKYYYQLILPTIEDSIEKTVEASKVDEVDGKTVILTKEDGVVTYTISYNVEIENYMGKAEIEIVDTLPAGIDQVKSNLAGGDYDEEKNTITWTETIENIDTFTNGNYTKQIEKQIIIVYVDQDVTEDLVNEVKGTVTTYYPDNYIEEKAGEEYVKAETEDTATVKQEYKVNFKLEKVWEDNEDLKEKRPESITAEIKLMQDDEEIRVLSVELNEENEWQYEEKGLRKYNDRGEEIEYIITERETEVGDLEYYEEAKIETTETEITEDATNYTVTITNTYKLIDADFDTEITKTGTSEITTSGDEVSYTIHFTSEISDYIGDGKVTIVDRLPYAIDEEASNIAEGSYDEETKTIIWTEELPHINTETGEAGESTIGSINNRPDGNVFVIDITKQITLVYKDIDLTEEKMTNSVKGKVELYDIDEKDEDTASVDTEINVEGKVIVRYIDIATGEDILMIPQDETYNYEITGKVGTNYETERKQIENYRYVEVQGEESGKIEEDPIEIIYVYEKIPAKVEVKYLEKQEDGSDKEIAESDIIDGYVGEEYETMRKEIESYRAVEPEPENAKGKITEETIEVKYYYERIVSGTITVRYVDIDTNEDIDENYGDEITGLLGEEYETEEKVIPYYVFVNSTENTTGTLTKQSDTVIYYYRKQIFNFSIDNTIESIILNGEAVQISDEKLAKIEIKSADMKNTELLVSYKIRVINDGEIAGNAKVLENIPEGYEIATIPEYWTLREDGTLETQIQLNAGESKDLSITLRWINGENNLGSKASTAQIEDTSNNANYEEINIKDNTSTVTVITSIKTGESVSAIIIVTLIISFVISGYISIVLVKRMGKGPYINDIKFLNK